MRVRFGYLGLLMHRETCGGSKAYTRTFNYDRGYSRNSKHTAAPPSADHLQTDPKRTSDRKTLGAHPPAFLAIPASHDRQ